MIELERKRFKKKLKLKSKKRCIGFSYDHVDVETTVNYPEASANSVKLIYPPMERGCDAPLSLVPLFRRVLGTWDRKCFFGMIGQHEGENSHTPPL